MALATTLGAPLDAKCFSLKNTAPRSEVVAGPLIRFLYISEDHSVTVENLIQTFMILTSYKNLFTDSSFIYLYLYTHSHFLISHTY
jgi:hypothetical protein